ncbi:hypothetical protein Ahy_A04g020611 [Arachis hypogaea]|uniref:Uncharacterized protein n=1 Tax=Arachis hypogaea TaxID=3818 RepID=A0A445DI21_ARAHY|nr:hypothetical protein Ahy_A04g020611 [Arachis hypogaea]
MIVDSVEFAESYGESATGAVVHRTLWLYNSFKIEAKTEWFLVACGSAMACDITTHEIKWEGTFNAISSDIKSLKSKFKKELVHKLRQLLLFSSKIPLVQRVMLTVVIFSMETITLGDKRIGIKTTVLEEKATACNMLCCYADELKEGFFPWIDQVAGTLVPLLKFYFHEEVRKVAVSAMLELLRSAKLAIEKGQSQGWDASYLKFLSDRTELAERMCYGNIYELGHILGWNFESSIS